MQWLEKMKFMFLLIFFHAVLFHSKFYSRRMFKMVLLVFRMTGVVIFRLMTHSMVALFKSTGNLFRKSKF